MIKLIVSDLDGTLLNDQKEMPTETFEIVLKLKQQGIHFVAASGRQYGNLAEKFTPIKDEIFYIAENGAFILEGSKPLSTSILPSSTVHELLAIAEPLKNIYPVVCSPYMAYIQTRNEEVIKHVEAYYTDYKIVENFNILQEDIIKIAFLDLNPTGSEHNVYLSYKQYEKELDVCVSAHEWMDIMIKGVNKGKALNKLQELLKVTKEETMVFGDFMNDYEMMKEAKYSYAMENAHPKIKEISRYRCASNNQQGVILKLKEIFKL